MKHLIEKEKHRKKRKNQKKTWNIVYVSSVTNSSKLWNPSWTGNTESKYPPHLLLLVPVVHVPKLCWTWLRGMEIRTGPVAGDSPLCRSLRQCDCCGWITQCTNCLRRCKKYCLTCWWCVDHLVNKFATAYVKSEASLSNRQRFHSNTSPRPWATNSIVLYSAEVLEYCRSFRNWTNSIGL